MRNRAPDINRAAASDSDEKQDKSGGLLAKLLQQRTVLLAQPIDKKVMERFTTAIVLMEADDAERPINVIVNSPGGDADSGFAMYDLLRFVRPPVRSLCAGLCASAAVPVFLGADAGQRFSLPHSRFLIHQPSMAATGVASDMEITAGEILKIRDKYNEIVARETGKPAKQVLKDANRDFWLAAPAALEYGIVSKIIERRAEFE